jgi:23S rRNA (cytidine1920-2'-O)/16S rRNA (cytidine1409-2'-O)-methyltransferase
VDVGASTGGFTDCLLQRGAARVAAVDVAYGELHWSLRNDDRVTALERVNVRSLAPDDLPYAPELIACDVSFIGLAKVLPALVACAAPRFDLLGLVKPQFEVGRERLGAGGVVRDPGVRADAVREVAAAALELGLGCRDVTASPLPGPSGNVEYFVWLRADAGPLDDDTLARAVARGPS